MRANKSWVCSTCSSSNGRTRTRVQYLWRRQRCPPFRATFSEESLVGGKEDPLSTSCFHLRRADCNTPSWIIRQEDISALAYKVISTSTPSPRRSSGNCSSSDGGSGGSCSSSEGGSDGSCSSSEGGSRGKR